MIVLLFLSIKKAQSSSGVSGLSRLAKSGLGIVSGIFSENLLVKGNLNVVGKITGFNVDEDDEKSAINLKFLNTYLSTHYYSMQGPVGPQGIQGIVGQQGVQGPPGSSVKGEQGEQGELSSTGSVAGESDARSNAENYLGRSMSDQEWEYLVRATAAEASAHPQERGAVMGVILNRARTNFNGYGTSVIDQLHARNQFQAVTGTRANGHQPSTWFTNMTTDTRGHIINSTQYLNAVDRDWFNFTSNNPAAYGRGTDITFLYGMRSNPVNRVIGDTIFGNR